MRDDETITDQGEDFEVYERKRPRKEVAPGSVPDVSRGGMSDAYAPTDDAPSEDAPADPDDGAWLMSTPETATAPEPGPMHVGPQAAAQTEDADAQARSGMFGGIYGTSRTPVDPGPDADPDPDTLPGIPDLPDPPTVPMRVQDDLGAPATAMAAPPAAAPAAQPSRTTSSPTPRSTSQRGEPMRIAIAATEFNYDITHMMIERARAHAEFLGASIEHVLRVPGVYDLPLAVKKLLGRSDVDAVATLGVVIEGETDHDDLVIQHAARKIIDLSLEHDKPVGLGITGPGMSRLQAEARIDRAKDAVEACVKLHRALGQY